jgi:hypothetical protein
MGVMCGAIRLDDRRDRVAKDYSLIWQSDRLRDEKRMTIHTRYLGSQPLLILALAAALLAGIVAVQWVLAQRNLARMQ